MKKVLVLLYGLCVLAVGIWFTACDMPNHNDEVYPRMITDKWEDTGFFGKTQYHISYKIQNGDSGGFMAFCTDGELGIDTKKK